VSVTKTITDLGRQVKALKAEVERLTRELEIWKRRVIREQELTDEYRELLLIKELGKKE
jgi:hypothetical protein